jgi:hypothetical protein
MEPENSSPCSQEPATYPYSGPNEISLNFQHHKKPNINYAVYEKCIQYYNIEIDLEEVWCGIIWVQWQAGFCESWSSIKLRVLLE